MLYDIIQIGRIYAFNGIALADTAHQRGFKTFPLFVQCGVGNRLDTIIKKHKQKYFINAKKSPIQHMKKLTKI